MPLLIHCSDGTFAFVIFCLPFYCHFVMFLVIVYVKWWSINCWHNASDQAVKHYSCMTGESLFQWGHTYLQKGYVWITPGIKAFLKYVL